MEETVRLIETKGLAKAIDAIEVMIESADISFIKNNHSNEDWELLWHIAK